MNTYSCIPLNKTQSAVLLNDRAIGVLTDNREGIAGLPAAPSIHLTLNTTQGDVFYAQDDGFSLAGAARCLRDFERNQQHRMERAYQD